MIASESKPNSGAKEVPSLEAEKLTDKREIMEDFFMTKALGKREHEFAKGVNTAAEAAQRPVKGKVL